MPVVALRGQERAPNDGGVHRAAEGDGEGGSAKQDGEAVSGVA
jgi:hypothetical protein